MFDFDAKQVLQFAKASVEWSDTVIDAKGNEKKSPIPGWSLSWKHGVIYIGSCPEHKAREAAALFILLYLKGVDPQMASQLIVAYAFIDSYKEAVEMYEGFINDINHFTREGLDNIHGALRINR